jgi:hypothetical protein
MLKSTLNDMLDNEDVEVPYFLLAIEGGDYGHNGEDTMPTMDEGVSNMEAFKDPFGRIMELKAELATSRILVENYKAHIEKLEIEVV